MKKTRPVGLRIDVWLEQTKHAFPRFQTGPASVLDMDPDFRLLFLFDAPALLEAE